MLAIIKIILPLVFMIIIGRLCGYYSFISSEGIIQIKKLITSIFLPVAVFHAIAGGAYSGSTVILFLSMFIILGIELAVG